MTRFGWVMTTYFAVVGIGATALFHPAPRLIWNASASVPIGLYAVHPAGALRIGELLVVAPPEPLATFLDARRYLPKGVPLLKHVAALPGQTVCRTSHTHRCRWHRDGHCARSGSPGAPVTRLAGLPSHRGRRGFPDEPAIGGVTRRPVFRPAAHHDDRRPGRSPLDRGGRTEHARQLRSSPANKPQPWQHHPSSLPAIAEVADCRTASSRTPRFRVVISIGFAVALLIGQRSPCRAHRNKPVAIRLRSLCGIRHRGSAPIRHSGVMDTRRDAGRERWRCSRGVAQGRDGPDADHAGDMGELASSLRSRR